MHWVSILLKSTVNNSIILNAEYDFPLCLSKDFYCYDETRWPKQYACLIIITDESTAPAIVYLFGSVYHFHQRHHTPLFILHCFLTFLHWCKMEIIIVIKIIQIQNKHIQKTVLILSFINPIFCENKYDDKLIKMKWKEIKREWIKGRKVEGWKLLIVQV